MQTILPAVITTVTIHCILGHLLPFLTLDLTTYHVWPVALLGLLSPGSATDGVTLFFLQKN